MRGIAKSKNDEHHDEYDFDNSSPEEECWICYHPGKLETMCRCQQRKAHKACLARWQFTNIGNHEEKVCRFCNEPYTYTWKENCFDSFVMKRIKDVKPVLYVTYGSRRKRIVVSSTGGIEAYNEILSHFIAKNEYCFNIQFTIQIHGCKTIALDSSSVTNDVMDHIIYLAKLACYKRSKTKNNINVAP
jgi:hypothetical protein